MMEILIAGISTGIIAPIYGYFLLSITIIFIYQGFKNRNIFVGGIRSASFWLLAVSGFMFALKYWRYNKSSLPAYLVMYGVNPIIIFMAAYVWVSTPSGNTGKQAEKAICAIAVGCGLHVTLNIIANLGHDRWNMVDFWGNIKTPATNLGSLNIFIFSLFPCIFMAKSFQVRVGGCFLFLLSLIYSFILGTRSQLVAMIMVLFVFLFLHWMQHCGKRIRSKSFLKLLTYMTLCFVILVISFKLNFMNIRGKIENSNLIYRFIDTNTVSSDYYRSQLFLKGIQTLFEYPFGGSKEVNYFHNYWLDIGRIAGIIPVMAVLLYDTIIVYHVWRIFKRSMINETLRYSLLCLNIGILLNFFVEPILNGYLDLFYRFCLINGLTEGLYYNNLKKENNCYE